MHWFILVVIIILTITFREEIVGLVIGAAVIAMVGGVLAIPVILLWLRMLKP